ncbi:MAG: hypothetical protein HYW85_07325 [Deltaproteobacteria bacterium]|nr:hypothetical protein [Deltaproteobacteria bacterium]MBI3017924.1 hypothetical protein [Deltaproteobacteria bacterium]
MRPFLFSLVIFGIGLGTGFFFGRKKTPKIDFQDHLHRIDLLSTLGQLAAGFDLHEPSGQSQTNVKESLSLLIKEVQEKIQSRHVELSLQFVGSIPWVLIPEATFKHIILDVLLNAIEALPKGGKIMIRTGLKDELVKVEIQDNGVGIPKEVLSRIFDPFFTTKTSGTGLGLSTCKDLVEQYRGKIFISSVENGGTLVTLYLPGRFDS